MQWSEYYLGVQVIFFFLFIKLNCVTNKITVTE